MQTRVRTDLRNLAIIAHVDHGKTTLVDGMLKQSNVFRDPSAMGSLILDSNDLEREKGITILAKNTAIVYRGIKLNVIDTPGHADFSGEVERVLGMADGCLLLVDAAEGPMPQTRYVLRRAFEHGLRPIVVINKVDRPQARPDEVLAAIQDLFLDLATDAEQLDFPVVYSIARDGRCGLSPTEIGPDLVPLFEAILKYVPTPEGDAEAPAQMLVSALDYDSYRGRLGIGRIVRGRLRSAMAIKQLARDGSSRDARVNQIFVFDGLERREVADASAGDIVAISGVENIALGDTLADPESPEALPPLEIEEPTIRMTFGVNTSPFAGREGQYSTSRQIRERLDRELETNVGLRVASTERAEMFLVSGRGELHLAILIETMRREGYEFEVSRPEVITKLVEGETHEPVEHVVIEIPEVHVGTVTEHIGRRKGQLKNLVNDGRGHVRLEFLVPTRGLIGFRNAFLTATRGEGTFASLLEGYQPWFGPISSPRNGALVAAETGTAVTYGLANSQERGLTFIEPGTEVYEGMIVGLNSRDQDLAVNVCKNKKMTNVRSSTSDIAIKLTPADLMSLERSIEFIEDDELLEVTPKSLRLRKRYLTSDERSKQRKAAGPR